MIAESDRVFRAYGFDAVLAGVHGPGAGQAAQDPAVAALVGMAASISPAATRP